MRNSQNAQGSDNRTPALTAIIPAYNECGRIGKVISVLLQATIVDEIIVVDDGSTDGMDAEVLQIAQEKPRLKLIRHPINQGKGQAIFTGCHATTAPVLLLLDADLINLTIQHVEALAQPVLSKEADMAIGLFRQGNFWTDLSHRYTPWLSGQRCVRAEIINDLPDQAARGYGFETCLSLLAMRKKLYVKRVPWIGVTHPLGILPRSGWSGLHRKAKMLRDIILTWLIIELSWVKAGEHRDKILRNR
jgi:glycosyltransferase involved in cell wall biosynthesis